MNIPGSERRLSDGTLRRALLRIPAAQPEQLPREQTLIEAMVEDLWEGGSGHETDITTTTERSQDGDTR